MDREKLYDYLTAAGKPMTIGQLCAQPEFAGIPRREMAQALQQLAEENIAFRSVRQGKAYYSSDSSEGVSRNPCQRNISNIASAMNAAMAGAQNPQLSQLGQLFRAMDGMMGADEEQESGESFRFTYNDGLVADCADYSIPIPDGFRLEMGAQDRDFIAWLPDPDSEEAEDARITLFAGQLSGMGTESMEPSAVSPEIMGAIILAAQWDMKAQTDRFLGPSELGHIPLLGEVCGSYLYSSNNYQIMLGFPIGIKQMRVLVQDAGITAETYHQTVCEWIGKLKLKNPFIQLPTLDSQDYLPLNNENLQKWDDAAARHIQRFSMLVNLRNQAQVKEYSYHQGNGGGSLTLLKKNIRRITQESMTRIEELNWQIAAFLKRAAAHDPRQKNLLKVYSIAKECQKNLTMHFNLGEDSVHLESEQTQALRDALELPEITALLAEEKRLEQEQKAAEEARRRREEEARKQEEAQREKQEALRIQEEKKQQEQLHRKRMTQLQEEHELRNIQALQQESKRCTKLLDQRLEADRQTWQKQQEKDQAELEKAYQRRVRSEKLKRKAKKTAKILLITLLTLLILFAAIIVLMVNVILPEMDRSQRYESAVYCLENGRYDEAQRQFAGLGDYKDSAKLALEAPYEKAEHLLRQGDYAGAIAQWESLADYSDSSQRAREALRQWHEPDYQRAVSMMEQEDFLGAAELFGTLDGYLDSVENAAECQQLHLQKQYQLGQDAFAAGEYDQAMEIFEQLDDYQDSRQMYQTCAYTYGCILLEEKNYPEAIVYLGMVGGYEDADEKKQEAVYQYGLQLLKDQKYEDAITQLNQCKTYKDSAEKLKTAKFNYVKGHLDRNNAKTKTYLNELIQAKYSGAQKLYDELYAWKVEIIAFSNQPYDHTPMQSISKYGGMYCHFRVIGGEPGKSVNLQAKITAPNGQSGTVFFNNCSDGSIWYTCFTYDNPYYGATGTMSVRIVDGQNKTLASGSVRVIN